MDTLLAALKLFETFKNMSELRTKALKWATKSASEMFTNDLVDMLTVYANTCSKAASLTEVEFNVDACKDLIGKVGQTVPDRLKVAIRKAFPALLSSAVTMVGSGKVLDSSF